MPCGASTTACGWLILILQPRRGAPTLIRSQSVSGRFYGAQAKVNPVLRLQRNCIFLKARCGIIYPKQSASWARPTEWRQPALRDLKDGFNSISALILIPLLLLQSPLLRRRAAPVAADGNHRACGYDTSAGSFLRA